LDIPDLTVERVTRFLASLEAQRCNSIATRNARLGAIHVFARYLASKRPEYLGILQRIIGMPFKRGAIEAPIEYLDRTELDALLKCINRSRYLGRRDYALFAFLFNTGARVQEVLDVRVADVRLEAPAQVRLMGKGRKVRICPLWPATARLVRDLIAERSTSSTDEPNATLVFTNARGKPLTRSHSMRHSTAVALLKSGVDFATISQWLGHAGLNTTMRYARADLDLKRRALAQADPGRPIRRLTRASCSALTDLVTRNAIPITIAMSPTAMFRTRFSTMANALTKKAMPANVAATPKHRARKLIKYTRSCFI